MRTQRHDVDLCVVGGGPAGLCAAVAAGRRGARVALVHDRPMLGGNASSEVRMWIGGSKGKHLRETGLIEELLLNNMHRNPRGNWRIWDSVLYELARFEPNVTLLLNTTCCDADVEPGRRINSIRAWGLTNETWHEVRAALFADCSGDGILAALSGAEFRIGREAGGEFGESIAPESADRRTMGLSLLIQPREMDRPVNFTPPSWAHRYRNCEDLPRRGHVVGRTNFWWIELGGEQDSIHDAEALRDELLKVAFGVWDHVKNHCTAQDASHWALDWIGFLPGKRESRRLVGDHVVAQNDVRGGVGFDDVVAYGGWSMDDHHPAGLNHPGEPTVFHPAPPGYAIPYRALYSRNVDNLLFAGRNISATHAAMSSMRVMATCAMLGQAAGTAAAIAAAEGIGPRSVYTEHLERLQQTLMDDDAYLPDKRRAVSDLTGRAALSASSGDPELIRNGVDRPTDAGENGWSAPPGNWIEQRWDSPQVLRGVRLCFDSNTNRGDTGANMPCVYRREPFNLSPPPQLVKACRIEAADEEGNFAELVRITDNHQRLVRLPLAATTRAVRLIPEETRGVEHARLFGWDVL